MFRDDHGQLMGTGMLIIATVAATFLMGVLWIFLSPAIGWLVDYFNTWVLAGWVTAQSRDIMNGLMIAWMAAPGVVFLAIMVNLLVKAYVLKEVRA
jgi:hypothetical protein